MRVERTWASGPLELLTHAASHLDYKSPFDSRIAFVSVDNAVELILKLYLQMPPRFFVANPPTSAEIAACYNNFPRLAATVSRLAATDLSDFPMGEVELYHRLRNDLYHNPAGYDVDARFLHGYFVLAQDLLRRLFGVAMPQDSPLLQQLRSDVLAAVAVELSAESKSERSAKAKAALRRAGVRGAQIGRRPKELTPEELALAAKLNSEGWGCESIAKELSAQRGAHLLTDPEAQRRAAISASALKRRLTKEGLYQPGRPTGKGERRATGVTK